MLVVFRIFLAIEFSICKNNNNKNSYRFKSEYVKHIQKLVPSKAMQHNVIPIDVSAWYVTCGLRLKSLPLIQITHKHRFVSLEVSILDHLHCSIHLASFAVNFQDQACIIYHNFSTR